MLMYKRKNAQAYLMPLFVIILLTTFMSLFIILDGKVKMFPKKIGEKQFSVIETSSKAERAQLFIDLSAELAMEKAVNELKDSGGLSSTTDCGQYRGVPIIEDGDCMPFSDVVDGSLEVVFNKYMDGYLGNFDLVDIPKGSFDLYLNENEVIGRMNKEMIIPIISWTSEKVDTEGLSYDINSLGDRVNCREVEILSSRKESELKSTYGDSEEDVKKRLIEISFQGWDVLVHEDIVGAFLCVQEEINNCAEAQSYDYEHISTFNWRKIRGGTSLSMHSFGVAMDINPQRNPMCPIVDDLGLCGGENILVTDIPVCVRNAFNRYGFEWGGDWGPSYNFDSMHFEFRGDPEVVKSFFVDMSGDSEGMCMLPENFDISGTSLEACEPYVDLVDEYMNKNGLYARGFDILLVLSLMRTESSCRHDWENNQGLMQVVECGRRGGCSIEENIDLGTKHLAGDFNLVSGTGLSMSDKVTIFLFSYNRGKGTAQRALDNMENGMEINDAMKEACFYYYDQGEYGGCSGFNKEACCTGSGLGMNYPKKILETFYYSTCGQVGGVIVGDELEEIEEI